MDYYSLQMATAIRNVVKMAEVTYREKNRGYIDIKVLLELQMTPAKAAGILKAFYSWYRKAYKPQDCTNDLNMIMHFKDQTPFYVCGVLSEFANVVQDIVATATIIDKAAGFLEKYGWQQGEIGGDDAGYCLLGALDRVLRGSPYPRGRHDFLWLSAQTALRDFVNTSFLTKWNDAPGRTVDEVKSLLRETAAGIMMVRD